LRTRIEQVKQDVAKQVAASLREQPEALSRLSELGLLDEAGLRALESGGDLRAVIFDFRDGIAELARTEPSVLQHAIRRGRGDGGVRRPRRIHLVQRPRG
jgi:hypothetical protein